MSTLSTHPWRTKIFGICAALIIVLGGVGAPLRAMAEDPVSPAAGARAASGVGVTGSAAITTPAASTRVGQVGNSNKNKDTDCEGFGACMADATYFIAVYIPSFVLYAASVFFSAAVKIALDSTTYALDFISIGWTVARDFANMLFLFVLVYIAFTIMLDAWTGTTMTTLAWVMVVALLVNFSFFGTRLVIDAGNVAAVQFYNAIPGGQSSNATVGNILASMQAKDLSASIMQLVNVQGLLGTEEFQKWSESGAGDTWYGRFMALSAVYLAVGALLMILIVTFFHAGVQFLSRIVYLWFAIMVSPLALVSATLRGTAFKQGASYFQKWSQMLISKAFYPAVFLFVFLFITIFANSIAGVGGGGLSSDTASAGDASLMAAAGASTNGSLGTMLFGAFNKARTGTGGADFMYGFGGDLGAAIILLILVVLMINVAISAGNRLAGGATKFALGAVGKIVGGGASIGGRIAGGSIGYAASRSEGLNRLAAGSGALSRVGRGTLWTANKMATGTWRPGNIGLVQKGAGLAGIKVGEKKGVSFKAGWEATRDFANWEGRVTPTQELAQARTKEISTKKTLEDFATKFVAKRELEPEDIKKLREFKGEDLVEHLNPTEVRRLAVYLADAQIQAIEKSTKMRAFGDKEKQDIRGTWNENAKDAPHQKTNALLKEVRDAVEELDEKGIKEAADLKQELALGKIVNESSLNDMTTKLSAMVDETRAQRQDAKKKLAARKIDAKEMQGITEQLLLTQKALNKVKKAAEVHEKIEPSNIKGTEYAAEHAHEKKEVRLS